MNQAAARLAILSVPVKMFLPVATTVLLFVMTIFFLVIPLFEAHLMEGKREIILSQTESAWSALQAFAAREHSGELSRPEAQRRAVALLRMLRYGPESKDYFWINDMQPRLIMHPYRTDLEGQDIAGFEDPSGKRLFVEFVNVVNARGAGYVDYLWQWMDDPERIVSKISYVKGFKPWNWIIGTGIYVEDVRAQIAAITRKLLLFCIAITAVIVGLSGYILWQGARVQEKRRRAEAALHKSEEKYRLLAETAGEFIITCSLDGKTTYANRACLNACNHSEGGAPGLAVTEFLAPENRERFSRLLDRRSRGDRSEPLLETEFLSRDGSKIPVEITATLMKDDESPTGFLITARDVTEKKKASEQARIHQEQLFQASKMASLGTLVSGVAHEISNPIAAVLLNSPIIEKVWQNTAPILDEHHRSHGDLKIGGMDYPMIRERMPKLLSSITDGALRVKKIVGDLKDFARRSPAEMSDLLDINRSVEKAVALVSNLIKKSTDHFEIVWGADIPRFRGNTQRIEQVVVNLLVNACQALPDPSRAIRVSTRYSSTEGMVTIEVRDQGVGIPPETIARIKDPFFTTKRDSGGTGLGLSISEKIVRDHGGSLDFHSDRQRGTTATVSLPVGDAENISTRSRP